MKTIISKLHRRPIVLIAEDNLDLRENVVSLLRDEGYDVRIAIDGRDALIQLLNSWELPDLVVTDLDMPNVCGQELVAAMRSIRRLSSMPILVYSGSLNFESDPRLEGCLFVKKPFDIDKLFEALKSLIIGTVTTVSASKAAVETLEVKHATKKHSDVHVID